MIATPTAPPPLPVAFAASGAGDWIIDHADAVILIASLDANEGAAASQDGGVAQIDRLDRFVLGKLVNPSGDRTSRPDRRSLAAQRDARKGAAGRG
jgi:hypothetical protein